MTHLIFEITYAVLWLLTLIEAVALRRALRQVVVMKRRYAARNPRQEGLRAGTRAPRFTAARLDGEGRLTGAELKGRDYMLLFVSPAQAASPLYQGLYDGIHGLWHKADGRLYIVCQGDQESCRDFLRDGLVAAPVAWDPRGTIARRFHVTTTPQAVMVDEQGRILRYGRPLSPEELIQDEEERRRELAAQGIAAPNPVTATAEAHAVAASSSSHRPG
jgi:hypothetical protein